MIELAALAVIVWMIRDHKKVMNELRATRNEYR